MSDKIIEEAESVVRALPAPEPEDKLMTAQLNMLKALGHETGELPPGVHTLSGDLTEFNRAWNILMKQCFLALLRVAHWIARFGAIE